MSLFGSFFSILQLLGAKSEHQAMIINAYDYVSKLEENKLSN